MRESAYDRITITETRASTFRLLLQYIYTGKINLREELRQQQQQQSKMISASTSAAAATAAAVSVSSSINISGGGSGGEDSLVDLLGCAHKYGFVSLQHAVSDYLETILDIKNVCSIYDIAALYQLEKLERTCVRFIDRNCLTLIKTQSLLALSESSLAQILARDSFCAPEVEIFNLIKRWHEINK